MTCSHGRSIVGRRRRFRWQNRLAATLLCDDAAARSEARRRGIPVIGTLGVLRLAKDRGLLDRIRPVIEAMRAAGMFVSEALVQEVLASAAEGDDEPTG